MAAPASKTIRDLNGKWQYNKDHSQGLDDVLSVQGVPYLIRSTLKLVTPVYDIKQFEAPADPANPDSEKVWWTETIQTTAGVKSPADLRALNNTPHEKKDDKNGNVTSWIYWGTVDDVTDEFLKEGWLQEGDGKLIVTRSENNEKGWKSNQVAGFRTINGDRYYVSRSVVEKGGKKANAQIVFSFLE